MTATAVSAPPSDPPPTDPTATVTSQRRRPPRAFQRTYSRWGLLGALLFFSGSLVPSLLPRSGVAQGLVSGITAVIGYGFACAFVALVALHGRPGSARQCPTLDASLSSPAS